MRQTNQLIIIKEIFQKYEGHQTANEIYKKAHRRLPAISLATVYRILNTLVTENYLERLNIEEGRYELKKEKHIHFICNKCGKIQNIPGEEQIKSIEENLKKKGMKVSKREIIFYGICKEC